MGSKFSDIKEKQLVSEAPKFLMLMKMQEGQKRKTIGFQEWPENGIATALHR